MNYDEYEKTKHPMVIEGMRAINHVGHLYFNIRDVVEFLNLKRNNSSNWVKFHELFYNSMRFLRIEPKEYPFPLNHIPVNFKGRISENCVDLPEWIMDDILERMARSKINNYEYIDKLRVLQNKFKNIHNMIKLENDIMQEDESMDINKPNSDLAYSNQKQNKPNPDSAYFDNEINLKTCFDGENEIKGFIKNKDIYLNSKDAAYMVGLYNWVNNNRIEIRWASYYKYFTLYSTMFNYNATNEGFNFRDSSNKAGYSSKYEILIPEYIPFKIVFMIANKLNNPRACKFRFDIIFTVLPFFIKNASDEEINKVEFLNSIAPLIKEFNDANQGANVAKRFILNHNNTSYSYNAPSLMTFFSNHNNYGMRPAIPGGWDCNLTGNTVQAYAIPDPEIIQRNLDSQKDRKEVVRFERTDIR